MNYFSKNMSTSNDQEIQDKKDLQQLQEHQSLPQKPAPKKTRLTKKKRLRLARLKRIKQLEERKAFNLNEFWNMIPSFSMSQYYFKSIFKIELSTFLLSLIFVIILIFSSNLGLYLPSRFESASLNTTLKIGFFKQNTIFYPKFNFKRKHSKFYFYYQFKKRDDPFAYANLQEENQIEIIIRLKTLNSKKLIKRFNTTIPKYTDVKVQPLFNIILDHPTDSIDLQIKFLGDLTNYKTFIIKSIVYNTTYLYFLNYYRIVFIIIGFIFIFHSFFQFLNFQNIQFIGYFTIMVNFPSVVFNIEKSTIGRITQTFADQLLTKSLLISWTYKTLHKIETKRPPNNRRQTAATTNKITKPVIIFFLLVITAQMVNILALANSESQNAFAYLSNGIQKSDKIYLFTSFLLVFIAYAVNMVETGSMRVNLQNFFFFAAQICAFCDDLIERCRVLKCVGMVKWMRIFIEFIAFFFLFVISRKEESESSERVMSAVPLNFEDESSMSKT